VEKRAEINKDFFGGRHIKDFLRSFAIILVAVAFSAGMCFAKTLPEFEKMKSLVGEWKGTSVDKKPATVIYTLVSDNSALMERLAMGGESEMVTMYHPDGDHLMMTHYCSARNQPRMRSQTVSAEINNISFDLVDVTNLSAPDAGHMKRLVLTFTDKDHFTQEWTWIQKGKEKTEVINFERMK
jgi:hypothetical protein